MSFAILIFVSYKFIIYLELIFSIHVTFTWSSYTYDCVYVEHMSLWHETKCNDNIHNYKNVNKYTLSHQSSAITKTRQTTCWLTLITEIYRTRIFIGEICSKQKWCIYIFLSVIYKNRMHNINKNAHISQYHFSFKIIKKIIFPI